MIHQEQQDHVLRLTLARPDKKNALTPTMYAELAQALEQVKNNTNIKAVLLQGSEGVFTAGNDINEFMRADAAPDFAATRDFMYALVDCPVPVVAKVEGLAIGIGTTLLLHCDFVYTSSNSIFAMPFINLGLVPEYASSYLLPKLCGRLKANELLLLGDSFNAEQALHYGIVNQVLDGASLQDMVETRLKTLTAKPYRAMVQAKMLLNHDRTALVAHIEAELKVFAEAMLSPQAREAFTAFAEKRPLNREIFN